MGERALLPVGATYSTQIFIKRYYLWERALLPVGAAYTSDFRFINGCNNAKLTLLRGACANLPLFVGARQHLRG